MTVALTTCPRCGRTGPADGDRCPSCGAARAPLPVAAPSATTPEALIRRVERLAEWADAAATMRVELPRLPPWTAGAMAQSDHLEIWEAALEKLERESRRASTALFETERERLLARLARLEAYAVDTRLERSQLEEASRAARTGDLPGAFLTFPQLGRIVEVKERHVDQARTDIERLLALLGDLEAMGIRTDDRAPDVGPRLEEELRAGRIAALRQQLRAVRSRSVEALRAALPAYLRSVGGRLWAERQRGVANDAEVRELADAARQILGDAPESGAHRLRRIGSSRGARPAATALPP